MRIIALVLLLTACSPEGAEPPTERLAYAGEGRDRLCIAGERFGFILFGDGDAYYCGPGADFTGRTLTKSESEMPVVDFAGDPLC